ncbi:MAG: EAL domain-containing response regulator [Sulfuritalea sp.]|nr:EAL domain-containing response regulator [Sulfuritalea sp.]
MILEDDEFQRNMLVGMLGTLGVASILDASNGKQALEIIHGPKSEAIDVVLCDLNMPEMDGMEFLRHLGAGHRNIAVILISALDSKLLTSVGRMTELYGVQLLGVIEKPVLPESLREHLLKYRLTTRKVPRAAAPSFALDEILAGIRADQFVPFFQPKVDMKSGRLTGAEALARWIHPDHGVIGPHAFIPALEQTGNIDDLTFRMLRKSAAALRSFHEKGHRLTVSVNLSLVSLDDTSLADRITQAVCELGVDPKFIVLEITESAAMTNVAPALENLARLCMNGFALSIDDYGTGSSNIQQLTRIAFSELKIDQSFVKDFADNKALRIVVESSIDMARKLLVRSVAEGVETQRDWDGLKLVGCDTVQGYFVARPMDEAAFHKFVADFLPF